MRPKAVRSTSIWWLFTVATTVSLTGGPKTVTVVDFDLSSLPGLVIYVAYGKTEAELSVAGHLGLVYTVPTPVTTTTTTTTRATTTTTPATTTTTTAAPTTTTTTTTQTTTTTTAGGGFGGGGNTAAQIAAGKALFNDPRFCIQCHGPVERVGRTAAQIQDSINGSVPAMSFLAALSEENIRDIATYLSDPANL